MDFIMIKKALQNFGPVIVTLVVAGLFALWQYERNVNEVNQTLLDGQKEIVSDLKVQMEQLAITVESTAKTNESIRRETIEITSKFRGVHDGFSRLEEQLKHTDTEDSAPVTEDGVDDVIVELPELDLAWQAFELASQGGM